MDVLTTETYLLIFFAFLLGGIVKGIIGTGLPTIALAIITATIGLKEAMAIILLPSILTNIGQGLLGGHLVYVVKRSWSFLAMTFCTVWIGASLITRVNISWLSALLGTILLIYAVVGLTARILPKPGSAESWMNPLFGSVNGLLTGLTGSSVIPGVLYLQSLGLKRDQLIQTMGLLFLISTSTLAMALQKNQLLNQELLILSGLAFIPAFLGMLGGIHIRKRISEALFRRLFFIFMLILGCYIFGRAIHQGIY
ncbi:MULTISPECIES: sulfite exporter TauE/SafE family protein [Desulfosediminicola]|uniref:sulfite exporter TauE/SafE family protein n=1 Tax=Desulfosediminicola TaxID=2886823 RepID=UPI0010AD64FE|nr:sulfite exporter TauE/SafE family protein [Desulfosediminicola ganghwensis]